MTRTLFQINATKIAIKAAYNLKLSIKNKFLFSIIDKSLTIIGVKTAKGIYLNVFFTDNGKSLENIPERGINLIKKVKFINSYSYIFSPRPGTVSENLNLIIEYKKITLNKNIIIIFNSIKCSFFINGI